MRSAITCLFLVLFPVLVGSVSAQRRTWIVDKNNGPGTTHTTVIAAIQSSRDDDKIIIRPGDNYVLPTSLSKAITFEGQGLVQMYIATQVPPLRIHGIAAGKTVTFRELTIRAHWLSATRHLCFVDKIGGTVVFDNVRLQAPVGAPSLNVVESPHVVLRNCNVQGYVRCERGRLIVVGGSIRAASVAIFNDQQPGIHLLDGEASLTGAVVDGGAAYFQGNAGHGVQVDRGRLMLRGRQSVVRGGFRTNGNALHGSGTARLILDPSVSLVPAGTGKPIAGFGQRVVKALPELRSLNTPKTGQVFRYVLNGKPRDRYWLFFSLPWSGFTLPDQEAYLFTPSLVVALNNGVLDSQGRAGFALQLSNDPLWSYWTFNIQGATANANEWNMTNEIILSPR